MNNQVSIEGGSRCSTSQHSFSCPSLVQVRCVASADTLHSSLDLEDSTAPLPPSCILGSIYTNKLYTSVEDNYYNAEPSWSQTQ